MQIAGSDNKETTAKSNTLLIFLNCNFSYFFTRVPYFA